VDCGEYKSEYRSFRWVIYKGDKLVNKCEF